MTEKKKTVVKTVNRSGKSLVKKALVVKGKKNGAMDAEKIKKLNEEKMAAKAKAEEKQAGVVETKKEKVIEDKEYDLKVELTDLLAAGSHLGHKTAKTHPRSRDNIYAAKDGIEIFDLIKSLEGLKAACTFIYNAQRKGKQIVMVGTKRQAKEVVKRIAEEVGVPYVTDRWLGGTITNWEQIRRNIKRLAEIKEGLESGKYSESTKKEISKLNKEVARLERIVGGLQKCDKLFDVIFVVDAGFEATAIREASLRGIKTVAMVDTDSDPRKVDYAIPLNDDSVKSINLVVEEIGKAIKAAGVK